MSVRQLLPVLAAVVSFLFAGCGEPSARPDSTATATAPNETAAESDLKQFADVGGEVIELLDDGTTARIRHEEIPDYMPAMIMPLKVKDAAELEGLANGDRITFRFNVDEDSHWIDQVKKLEVNDDTTTQTASTGDSNNPFTTDPNWRRVREVEPLNVGDVMPNYTFTNELGTVVSLHDLVGQPYAFTFIYTRCPIPDFCPLMSSSFMETQNLLKGMEDAPEDWKLFSITIDPKYDTVPVLKGYASRYKYDPEKWSFLTGELIDITAIAEQFGLMFYWPDETISHNLRTVVVNQEGRIHSIFIGNTWKPADLVTTMVDAGKQPSTQ